MNKYKCTICGKLKTINEICSIKVINKQIWIECLECRGYDKKHGKTY